MRKNILLSFVMCLFLFAAATCVGATSKELNFQIPKHMQSKVKVIQWSFESKGRKKGAPVLDGKFYHLFNAPSGKVLKKEGRVSGAADLGFTSKPRKDLPHMKVFKKGGGQIHYGDVIAIRLSKYGFIAKEKHRRGIDIGSVSTKKKPKDKYFEWKVTGGMKGTKLNTGMPFALHNMKMGKEMFYCKKAQGINLGWYGQSKCSGFFADASNAIFGEGGMYSGVKSWVCDTAIDSLDSAATGAIPNSYKEKSQDKCKNY